MTKPANPRVGRGLKPRTSPEETKPEQPETVSTVEGQTETPEAAPEPAAETAENDNKPEVQNLDPVPVADDLAEKLKASEETQSHPIEIDYQNQRRALDAILKRDGVTKIEGKAGDKLQWQGPIAKWPDLPASMGTQPNGDHAVRLIIPEFYVESCRQWGEADGGKSIEQWANEFFLQQLEYYVSAPATR